jgi:hypothetical protein
MMASNHYLQLPLTPPNSAHTTSRTTQYAYSLGMPDATIVGVYSALR